MTGRVRFAVLFAAGVAAGWVAARAKALLAVHTAAVGAGRVPAPAPEAEVFPFPGARVKEGW